MRLDRLSLAGLGLALTAFACSSAAPAANITLSTNLINSCVLTLNTQGVLVASADGTILSSELSGGAPAVMAVVAVGLKPTLSFSAPSLVGPADSGSTATTALSYNSTGGVIQATTSALSSHKLSLLLDTFTVHGRVTNPAGFAGGSYTVQTTGTCQQ